MKKAMSLDEKRNKITSAFMDMFYPSNGMMTNGMSAWVMEIYDVDGYLIACEGDDYFRVGFVESDGKYTFDARSDWALVERKTEWVERTKSLRLIASGNHLKTISKTDDELRVGNYIVLFGGRDLEWMRKGRNPDGSIGEYFSKSVDLESTYTATGRLYVDWEHGDGKVVDGKDAPGRDDILGYVDWKTVKRDDRGVFVERVLNRRNEYMKFLEELIDAGLIGNSSEPVGEQAKVSKTGEITKWPLRRDTLTVSPAEPRMMTENVISAIKSLSEINPNLKALLPQAAASGGGADRADYVIVQLKARAFLLTEE